MDCESLYYLETKDEVEDISRYSIGDVSFLREKEHSENINIDVDEFHGYNNWYLIDGEYYYFKYKYAFIELFMCELMREFSLRTPEQKVVKASNGSLREPQLYNGILSKNFRLPGYLYEDLDVFLNRKTKSRLWYVEDDNALYNIKGSLSRKMSKRNFKTFYDRLSTLAAVDFYTGQSDRYSYNLLIETDSKGKSDLAPITDNGMAFRTFITNMRGCLGYVRYPLYLKDEKGVFLEGNINESNYMHYQGINNMIALVFENDEYRHTLERLLDTNMTKLLRNTMEKYKVVIASKNEKDILSFFDEKKQCVESAFLLARKIKGE